MTKFRDKLVSLILVYTGWHKRLLVSTIFLSTSVLYAQYYGESDEIGSTFLWILLWLFSMFLCGFLARWVAKEKGYKGATGFLLGFFFTLLGLIAVAGLPVKHPSETGKSEHREAMP